MRKIERKKHEDINEGNNCTLGFMGRKEKEIEWMKGRNSRSRE